MNTLKSIYVLSIDYQLMVTLYTILVRVLSIFKVTQLTVVAPFFLSLADQPTTPEDCWFSNVLSYSLLDIPTLHIQEEFAETAVILLGSNLDVKQPMTVARDMQKLILLKVRGMYCSYEATSSRKSRSLPREIATAVVASVFLVINGSCIIYIFVLSWEGNKSSGCIRFSLVA